MDCKSTYLPYEQTGAFSPLIIDYLKGSSALTPFYNYPVSLEGIKFSITARKAYNTDREVLRQVLEQQYKDVVTDPAVTANIALLSDTQTFTVTTAHQPNIFTGHLYFIYKIMHVIRLAEDLRNKLPGQNFVPVFYMGSEDADLEELGQVHIDGQDHKWETGQTGAVGRMKVDKPLRELVASISGQLSVMASGKPALELVDKYYKEGVTIEQATFGFVNELFSGYGLVVLLPDNASLKRLFIPVIEKELNEGFSHKTVEETIRSFPDKYKVQAGGREINLFYLQDGSRERIEKDGTGWKVVNTQIRFTATEMKAELNAHPERFSPNVILRPLFQERILPNIAFVGGGGEIAYWLELKKTFEAASIPFPVLILRNSFLIVNKEMKLIMEKLDLKNKDLFRSEKELADIIVKVESELQLDLTIEKEATGNLFAQLKKVGGAVDAGLATHAEALKAQFMKKLDALEKKMVKLEKRKFETQMRQLHKLKSRLFPNNGLQERVENLLPYYARWGKRFIDGIYDNSLGLEQQFGILVEC